MAVDVANVVTCGCGYVIRGDELEEMLEEAVSHVRGAHPELIGTLSPLELARPPVESQAAA